MLSFSDVKQKALELGWDDVGVCRPEIPEEDIVAYRQWLHEGLHGELSYMENQLRCAPQELLPGAQSAILFISYYKQEKQEFPKEGGLVASYARGRDYHNVHHRRLKKFIRWLEEVSGQEAVARGFSDSKPILERALAVQAGLGWFGKNTLLIHKKFGTFTLLSGVLCRIPISHEAPRSWRQPRCGSCTRCLDACPTQALSPYKLDARKCLSYHLIEAKGEVPDDIRKQNPGYAFGCDICQDSCPHNWRKRPAEEGPFSPSQGFGPFLTMEDIERLKEHPETLHGTPLKRRGPAGLEENLRSK